MLMPKKTKFRKVHRGRRRGYASGQTVVQYGDYGLKAIDCLLYTSDAADE